MRFNGPPTIEGVSEQPRGFLKLTSVRDKGKELHIGVNLGSFAAQIYPNKFLSRNHVKLMMASVLVYVSMSELFVCSRTDANDRHIEV